MIKEKLLRVKNLRVSFGEGEEEVVAVGGISFDLSAGETLGIVGESGSGKSLTALSLMRLLPQSAALSAEALLLQRDGHAAVDLAGLKSSQMQTIRGKEIAMIFQEPMTSLNPVLRCGPQITEGLARHLGMDPPAARRRVLELFERVRLPQGDRIFQAYPHELSGGQKQRVMIAMALACQPSVLIADEPTTALDVTVQKAILELLRELQQELGTSVIFISHDLGVISEIADRVLVMRRGEIVEQGSVQEIFQRPQHSYTKGLLACRPPLGRRLRRLPVIKDFGDRTARLEVETYVRSLVVPQEETRARLAALEQNAPVLSVRNLHTWFPAQRNFLGRPVSFIKAVDDVSFDVYPGETLGLVGESGCGKTTLSRSILRLVEPRGGAVLFENKDLLKLPPEELRLLRGDIQIIFQDPYASLNPRMTVGSALMEPLRQHGLYEHDRERKEKVIELLETVQLKSDHFYRYPHEFSGGERQRICIARALGLNPRFLICDESVSALDVSVQAQVLNLLKELQVGHQLTYIFISHDLSVVKFMSDRMLVMYGGKIVEEGPADDIYERPKNEYTRRLIEAIPGGMSGRL